jgi:Peptidase M15
MITLDHYWRGRDMTHGLLLSTEMRRAASRTVEIANALIVLAKVGGVSVECIDCTDSIVTSGWRPPDVNAATPGARLRSLHLQCEAIDLYDPDGEIDDWLMSAAGQKAMADLGLWHEHPSMTKEWAHVQTRPPKSGRRTFYP